VGWKSLNNFNLLEGGGRVWGQDAIVVHQRGPRGLSEVSRAVSKGAVPPFRAVLSVSVIAPLGLVDMRVVHLLYRAVRVGAELPADTLVNCPKLAHLDAVPHRGHTPVVGVIVVIEALGIIVKLILERTWLCLVLLQEEGGGVLFVEGLVNEPPPQFSRLVRKGAVLRSQLCPQRALVALATEGELVPFRVVEFLNFVVAQGALITKRAPRGAQREQVILASPRDRVAECGLIAGEIIPPPVLVIVPINAPWGLAHDLGAPPRLVGAPVKDRQRKKPARFSATPGGRAAFLTAAARRHRETLSVLTGVARRVQGRGGWGRRGSRLLLIGAKRGRRCGGGERLGLKPNPEFLLSVGEGAVGDLVCAPLRGIVIQAEFRFVVSGVVVYLRFGMRKGAGLTLLIICNIMRWMDVFKKKSG